MQTLEVTTDFNGIVMLCPDRLEDFYGTLSIGENLYEKFVGTTDGDTVIREGIIVPIIGINDSTYRIIIRDEAEPSSIPGNLIIVSNHDFPLIVTSRAVIADMAVLLEWSPEESWQDVKIEPGNYSVCVNGFRQIQNDEVIDFGFEFVLSKRSSRPEFTASLEKNMQVLELPGE